MRTALFCLCNHTYEVFALHTALLWPNTGVQQINIPHALQGKNHAPMLTAALSNVLTAVLCLSKYTYENLQCTHVCNGPHLMHSSKFPGQKGWPAINAATPNILKAALCLNRYTCEDLHFMQTCSDPCDMHCNNGHGKMHFPLLSVALQKRVTSGLYHCSCTCEHLLFIQVCIA